MMSTQKLTKHISLVHTANHIHIEFDEPYRITSSAVLNGGFVEARHIVNLKVDKHSESQPKTHELPTVTLSKYCEKQNWQGTAVGMMTAASMDSLRITREAVEDIDIIVLVTSGISNPRRAGDRAEYREISAAMTKAGTINTICLTSAKLSQSAMVETIVVATEAKSAALQKLGVMSPISNELATGTGTDAIAIASGQGPIEIAYCGKHVLLGEILARLVIEAVTSSITWKMNTRPNESSWQL